MSDNTFTVEGPEGTTIEFPVGTSPEAVKAAFGKIGGATAEKPLGFDPADPRFAEGPAAAASTLRGIPLLGAGVNRLGAAASALAHPLTGVGSDASTIADRYVRNLEQEDAAQLDRETKKPIMSSIEGIVGGGLALGGAAGLSGTIAKGLGMVGPMRTAVPLASATGAALNAGDAALRGEDPVYAAKVGAAGGGLGVLGGKAGAKALDLVRGAVSKAPLVPHTMDVNGRAVPIDQAILSGSAADSTAKQAFIHQAEPKTAQMARDAGEATDIGMRGATEDFKSDVGPQGASEPHTAKSAAQAVQEALQEGNAASRQNVKAAYDAAGAAPGEYNPSAIQNTPKVIRSALDQEGPDRVVLDQLTPRATQALDYLSTDLGQLRFENAAATPMRMGPDGRPLARPITPTVIEQARKNLNNYLNQAVSDGNATDIRAVKRIKSAFDKHITNVINAPGGFSGDAAEVLRLQSAAREAHATHKANYSAGSPQDAAGKVIESIIGKRGAAPLDVEQIVPKLFGSPNNPGGGAQSTLVQRLVKTFGQNRTPVHAMRQGLFSHAADMLPGMTPVGHKAMSDRITKIVNGSVGKALYTPAELARAQAIASAHQRIVPVPGTTNPPGSGHVVVKGMKAMAKAALPMLGAALHGPVGLAAGLAAEKAASAIAARRSAAAAREFFHGTRAPLPKSMRPQGFGALGGLTIGERQSR